MKKFNGIRADRVQKLMKINDISVIELAEAIGKTLNTTNKIVTGVYKQPKYLTFVNLCDYLNCTSDYLLGLSDVPNTIGG